MASKRPSDEFDEYEYLEKMVEEQGDTKKKKKDGGDAPAEKNDRGYRKKEADREDNDDEEDRSSRKRSRGRGEEDDDDRRDRDKDRRRSSRDRDRDRERDRERDGERSSKEREKERDREKKEREREKEKEKERERERERDRREREKERERRDREKEKEKEKERERRERSSSRPRRHDSDRDKEWEKEKERELENKESRRFRDKKEAVEPEADPERDQRTVFAYQMPLKATERDVFDFFSKAGRVRDVRLIMDRNSRRSKGVGYIEFYDVMSVPMAIALSGQLLFGQPVMVKPSEAEKNLVQSTTATGSGGVTGPYGAVDRKLYVGNLHFNMTEVQLRQIFEAFGPVELIQLPLDLETGQCKGFGFVQFARLEDAKAAQSALNGKLDIAGRFIKVSSVTDHVGTQDSTAKSADFDDDEGGGLALNAQSRAILMQKLDRSGIATSIAGPLGVPMLNGQAPQQTISLPTNGQAAYPTPNLPMPIMATAPVVDPIGQPSECLLLKNMFDASTEAEPDFDLDIKEDVEEECSKYGRVKHIYVDKNSAGLVYLRFDSVDGAARAQKAMHMRWFARRSISAVFMRPQEYEAKFGG